MQGSLTGRITSRIAILAALLAGAAAPATATAVAAQASSVRSICTPGPNCANFWGSGFLVKDWNQIGTANDNMQVQYIGGGNVQVFDLLHGGCVGDDSDISAKADAGGGLNCPSSGNAAWGTVFTQNYAACSGIGQGWFALYNHHWHAYMAIPTGNGQTVYLNVAFTRGNTCFAQF